VTTQFVGVVGGSIGKKPFDRRTWSGSSYFLFSTLKNRGHLHRAFGAEPSPIINRFCQVRNYSRSREVWRRQYYMDRIYRDALTRSLQKHIQSSDIGHPFLQIGAMFNMRSVLRSGQPCYSYHDGTLTDYLRSPFASKNLSRRRIDQAMAYEYEVYSSMTRVLTMSEFHRQSIIQDFHIPQERVVNVGFGANLDELPPYVPGKEYRTREVLFIGTDFERKGGPNLLKAFQRVTERYPDAKLHIVGPRALEIPRAFSRGVILHGFLNKTVPEQKAHIDELYRRCALFVLPSLREGVGVSCVESMLHRLPCLVSNGWGLTDAVIPGETGDLVEPGNVDELAQKLLRYLGDAAALQEMGEKAYRTALNVFSWPLVVDRILGAVSDTSMYSLRDGLQFTRPYRVLGNAS
jgi:starch synthase